VPAKSSSKRVIYAALAGNLLVALTKFAAAFWTGSSAMLSEAIHSLVDTSNQVLLLYGIHRSSIPPDADHPLGHGRELYFWSFIVALLMFMLGAGVTFFEGVSHIIDPHEVTDPYINYIVLGCSAVFEGATWAIALKEFRKTKGGAGYLEAIKRSKDPPSFMVLFEDTAALLGLLIAFAGTLGAQLFAMPRLDGVAAVGISLVLGIAALLLARESKGLLIGETASPRVNKAIIEVARKIPGIERADVVFTVHLAPTQIVAALSVEFADSLTTSDIEKSVLALEGAICGALPDLVAIFIKPQTAGAYRSSQRMLGSAGQ
jgi:cation diffusion facilitator family transporter